MVLGDPTSESFKDPILCYVPAVSDQVYTVKQELHLVVYSKLSILSHIRDLVHECFKPLPTISAADLIPSFQII